MDGVFTGFGLLRESKPAVTSDYTVAISGANGLVGTALRKALSGTQVEGRQVKVLRLVRRRANDVSEISWDPASGTVELEKLDGIDAIVHLAGEGVASGSGPLAITGRWDDAKKETIMNSRVQGTATIVNAIKKLNKPPHTFICSSAIGYYGYTGGDVAYDEGSAPGGGFLASVCERWEAEAAKAKSPVTRAVSLRTGVILSQNGGALAKLLPIFKLGVGGNLGSGEQYFSWVSLRDIVRIIVFLLDRTTSSSSIISGPVNACAPGACTNAQFTKALGAAISRPVIFPVPTFAGEIVFGEMGKEMLFGGQNVVPKKLLDAGFVFIDKDINSALDGIFN